MGFNQETQLTRVPGERDVEGAPLVRVRIRIQEVRDMELHLSNLVFGRPVIGTFLSSNFFLRQISRT